MKHIFTTLIFCISILIVKSQDISPSTSAEFCPNIEYTFTTTLAKTYLSMYGQGGCVITQLPSTPVGATFTFKARFGDANKAQQIIVRFTDNTSTPFDFKNIKSLFHPTTCATIQPNVGSNITAPRCQITNFPISFSNIPWSTSFESTVTCFGSITEYEYLLPNGWYLGSTPSNGSTWLPGNNNVVVTSDLTHGAGQYIRIRPVACGTGLSNGDGLNWTKSIYILRDVPSLDITPYTSTICNGQNAQYTVSGVPPGSTVSWAISNPSAASVTPSPSNQNVCTVTHTGNVNQNITLTATVTDCMTFSKSVNITLGNPQASNVILWSSTGSTTMGTPVGFVAGYPPNNRCQIQSTDWQVSMDASVFTGNVPCEPENGTSKYIIFQSPGTAYVQARIQNGCGWSDWSAGIPITVNSGYYFTISPNPTSSEITVTQKDKTTAEIAELAIFDNNGNLKKQSKYARGTKQAKLSVLGLNSGIYFIEISSGQYKERQQLVIQK